MSRDTKDMRDTNNAKNVYITGVRRGIGRAVAGAMAERGHSIAGCSRHLEGLDELQRRLMAQAGALKAHLAVADIRDPAALRRWVDTAVEEVGPPEVVIHAAAVLGPRKNLLEVETGEWAHVMETNTTGALNVLQATAAQARSEAPALWLWVTSSVGAKGRAGWGPYGASKAAIDNLNETLAAELGEGPWASATLNPGRTRTDMRRKAVPDEDPSKLPAPETVAKAFMEVVTRWTQGAATNGRRFNARDLVDELTRPSDR